MPPKQIDQPNQVEIPTAKVTVRLTTKKPEDGPCEVIIATAKGVKPASSAKGWFYLPKEVPASTLEFQTEMNLWDTLKGVQGLLVSFSPLSDKKPVSDTNPIMSMSLVYLNGPLGDVGDHWAANMLLSDAKLKSLVKCDVLGWAVWF